MFPPSSSPVRLSVVVSWTGSRSPRSPPVFPGNGFRPLAPPFPHAGPGEPSSPRSAVLVSTDSGQEQDFNSLDNQREASEAYIKSQAHEGWKLVRERSDDDKEDSRRAELRSGGSAPRRESRSR